MGKGGGGYDPEPQFEYEIVAPTDMDGNHDDTSAMDIDSNRQI